MQINKDLFFEILISSVLNIFFYFFQFTKEKLFLDENFKLLPRKDSET